MHLKVHQKHFRLRCILIVACCSLIVGLIGHAALADDVEMGDAFDGHAEPLNSPKVPSIFNYEQYLSRFQKLASPSTGPYAIKFLYKAKLFIARTLKIFKHNALYAAQQVNHYLKQNAFTDMPREAIKKWYVSDSIGLGPIREARLMPDMPAETYMLNQYEFKTYSGTGTSTATDTEHVAIGDTEPDYMDVDEVEHEDAANNNNNNNNNQHAINGDGLSQATSMALEDSSPADDDDDRMDIDEFDFFIRKPTKLGDQRRRQQGHGADFEIDNLLGNIHLEPEMAKKTLRISSPNWQSLASKRIDQDGKAAEKASAAQGVVRSMVVKPNNRHYDAGLLPSYGLLSDLTNFIGRGIDDDDDDDDVRYDQADLSEYFDEDNTWSHLSSLVGKIGNYFRAAGVVPADDDDDDEDTDIDNVKDAKEDIVMTTSEAAVASGTAAALDAASGSIIVYDIDWRSTGCISRPKAQMNCNSCYAFAVLDMMEFAHCRQKKTHAEFSAQYVLDCGDKTNLLGCESGKLSDVGRFIKSYGLQLNALYPYQARKQQCPFDETSDRLEKSYIIKPVVTGWRIFETMRAWYDWLPKTPIIVGINMPTDFLAYGGGIHDGRDCATGMVHAMLLVGSGQQDGQPFWLMKNSFSKDWGETGYFRLSKRAPLKCFNSALVARVNFNVMFN